MKREELLAALADIPLGGLRFYERIASTNDEAASWASDDAPDFALVMADEQTAGRGRSGNRWFTPPGSALAFSLILKPVEPRPLNIARMAGLGALAVAEACEQHGLQPQIKWPNDVLSNGRKLAGILVESVWMGNMLEASVVGIGVNVLAAAVPSPEVITYPATSMESELGHPLDRIGVLKQILRSILSWKGVLATAEFMQAWEGRLAFRGQEVMLTDGTGNSTTGVFLGLEADGSARLEANHRIIAFQAGQMSLRPSNDRIA